VEFYDKPHSFIRDELPFDIGPIFQAETIPFRSGFCLSD
jgi:hypothetical protein